MGTLIVVGVIVLVLALFVGLVWLFVKIAPPPQPRLPEPAKNPQAAARPTSSKAEGKTRR